jgi:TRAP-type C4-dicarboxylate transport system substrate-binding protein
MTGMHISQAIGATVVTKKDFDKLPADLQKILLADSKELESKLLKQIRAENDKATKSLVSAGVQIVDSPKEMVKEFEAQSTGLRSKLEPSVYSHEFRMKVEKLLADYRAGKK